MSSQQWKSVVLVLGLSFLCLSLVLTEAQAVPSFGRQVGMDCNVCHTVFPELTPFGRNFKLTGYTMSIKSDKPYEWPPPLSAAGTLSFTNVERSMPKNVVEFNNRRNDNVTAPQEIILFYAGRVLPYVGAFVEGAYDGNSHKFLLDHTDIRISNKTQLANRDLVLGLTINNNPGVQDVLNTFPAFGFPWASTDVALKPAASTIFEEALENQLGGIGAYFYWNNLIYGEFTAYRTSGKGISQFLGAGSVTETNVKGMVPYWRVFLQRQWGRHSLAFGHFGMVADIFPEGESRGPTDHFTDLGLDAQYQFIGKKHIFTAQTSWIHEIQDRQASFGSEDGPTNRFGRLDTYKINLNYYYRSNIGTFGGTAAYFTRWGNKDEGLFAPNPGDGSRTGKPNSDWFVIEGSYLPTKYTKVTLQYTIYNQFNGARNNYDGFHRNASDNNTLFLLLWLTI